MRRFLALAVVPFALPACSSSDRSPSGLQGDGGVQTPPAWDRAVTRPDDATASASRAACAYARGSMPAETLSRSTPVDADIPLDTIVVLMQENRSFDSYFAHLGKYAGRTDIESAPDTASNPDAQGKPVAFTRGAHLCFGDTNHEWSGSHVEYDDGKMDGFAKANADGATDDGARALWWYDERDIPFYYSLASTFAIADHYHCSLLGPTWPNRMYLIAATSFGMTFNLFPDISAYPFPDNDASVLDELEKRHTSWMLYSDGGPPGAGTVYGATGAKRWGRTVTGSYQDFLQAAQSGTLPQVSFLDAKLGNENGAGTDEHPPADIQGGEKWVSDVVRALFASPQWAHMALFLTYDEHGGIYDHVPPPSACAPDAVAPILDKGDTTRASFDRYGVRVPLIVVSPYAKRSYVGHHVYDHTSITRFIEAKFKIPALTARDANAEPPMDMFDFSAPALATPPSLADAKIDATEQQYCSQTYPPK